VRLRGVDALRHAAGHAAGCRLQADALTRRRAAGDRTGRLFTLTAQVPTSEWAAQGARLRECVASFRVFEQS
jgi:hypothetical protein